MLIRSPTYPYSGRWDDPELDYLCGRQTMAPSSVRIRVSFARARTPPRVLLEKAYLSETYGLVCTRFKANFKAAAPRKGEPYALLVSDGDGALSVAAVKSIYSVFGGPRCELLS